jgi:hypothetical protein
MVIANNSGVKKKEILYRGVIFLGEFPHCGYKKSLKKLGKFVLIVKWKKSTKFTNHKIEKKKKEKRKNSGTEVYMCAL